MRYIYIFLSLVLILLPVSVLGAVLTDESSYAPPATVYFTSDYPGAGCVLYYSLDGYALPYLYQETMGCGASGDLNSINWTNGTFDGTIEADYKFVQASSVGCSPTNQPPNGFSYATCAINNPGMPGDYEADFTITSATSTATTTVGTIEDRESYLFLMVLLGISALFLFLPFLGKILGKTPKLFYYGKFRKFL